MGFSWTRAGTWIVGAVIGIVYGVAGTIGQAAMWGVIPLGLLIAVIGIGALLIAVRALTADRWAALAAGIGAMVATLVFSGKGPGGSVVVPAPADGQLSTGLVWTIAVPIIAAVVVGWPALTRRAATATAPATAVAVASDRPSVAEATPPPGDQPTN